MPYGSRPLLILGSGRGHSVSRSGRRSNCQYQCQGPKPVQGWFRYCGGLTISGEDGIFSSTGLLHHQGWRPKAADVLVGDPADPGPAHRAAVEEPDDGPPR